MKNYDHLTVRVQDDESGLPGAVVDAYYKGQKIETHANTDGEAVINLKVWDSLKIDFIGYKPLTIKYEKEDHFTVLLKPGGAIGPNFKNEKWLIKGRRILDPRFAVEPRRYSFRKIAH